METNAIVIKGKTFAAVKPTVKNVKGEERTMREFRVNGMYANFWGDVDPKKEYEFVYQENKNGNGGVLKCINGNRREIEELVIADDKVVTRKASVAPVSPLLALLKGKANAIAVDVDEDED